MKRGLDRYSQLARSCSAQDEERLSLALSSYAVCALPLVAEDADTRQAQLTAVASGPESLAMIAGLQYQHENHALTLAWLLDPMRSGKLATLMWPHWLHEIPRCAGPTADRAHALAQSWPWWETLSVAPDQTMVDRRVFDLRVRTGLQGQPYHHGLVVQRDAACDEPTVDADRLVDAIAMVHGHAAVDKTLFVWLTPDGRRPPIQAQTRDKWHAVSWHQIVRMLKRVASTPGLSSERVAVLLEYQNVIATRIFERVTPTEVHGHLAQIEHLVGIPRHTRICALQTRVLEGKE